ncbi:MAG TPA: hypothetical protein PKZ08_00545 [Vicinamibacterales bacterium]|nr:hypothetical protein [Vicinamibacterales bacterium]
MPRTWTKSHEQQMARILALMQAEARPFADRSPEAAAARRGQEFDAWARTYLPHYFSAPSAPMHRIADDLVEERGIVNALKWGREMGKSVRYGIAKPLWWALKRDCRFVIFGARNEDDAIDKLDFVNQELKENARLRADYGAEITPRAGADEGGDWIACGVRFLARGIGQSCRGQLHGPYRPDVFIGDDLEDEKLARSSDREKELWTWLFTNVWGALSRSGSEARFILLLNTFGRHSLAAKIAERAAEVDKAGRAVMRLSVFPSVNEAGDPAWPERHSRAALDRAEVIIGSANFRREYRCIDGDENAKILPEYIRTFSVAEFDRAGMMVRVGVDSSSTEKETSDYKAVIVLARAPARRDVYCLSAWIRRATPQEMIRELYRVWDEYHPPFIAAEANGFQSWLREMVRMREDLDRRATRIALRPWINSANKADKLLSHEGLFQGGCCWFDPTQGDQKLLLSQWYSVGGTKDHDDGPDAWDIAWRQFPAVMSARGGAAARRSSPAPVFEESAESLSLPALAAGGLTW